jgi:hypothetical protein
MLLQHAVFGQLVCAEENINNCLLSMWSDQPTDIHAACMIMVCNVRYSVPFSVCYSVNIYILVAA